MIGKSESAAEARAAFRSASVINCFDIFLPSFVSGNGFSHLAQNPDRYSVAESLYQLFNLVAPLSVQVLKSAAPRSLCFRACYSPEMK
jgi:hypothetical protein